MRRPFQFLLIVLALLAGTIAMRSGAALASMPGHHATSQAEHCGGAPVENDQRSDSMAEHCASMCAALATLGGLATEPVSRPAPVLSGGRPVEYRPVLAELPTPPPRMI